MTRKIFSVFCFAVAMFISCGKETGTDEKEGSAILLCMTSEASGVTQTLAILNGTATIKNAKASNANAYFYYSTTQADAKTLKASGQRLSAGNLPNSGGDFSANLSSLSPATTYYYVASISIDDQEELGSVKSFTTEKKTDSFSVTGAAIDITVNSATLTAYANLPAHMTGDVTIGIIYSTNSSPSLQNGKLLTSKDLDGNNMYQVKATYLTPETKYYFKSYLSGSGLNYYGEVKEFTTAQVVASVSTLDAMDITEATAVVGGKVVISSKGVPSKSAAIYYGTEETSAEALKTNGKKVSIGAIDEDGSFKSELTGLTASTKYYYIAVVTLEGIEFTGAVKNFTTKDKIIITGESADVGESSVKLYGWCNRDGAEGFGIEYSPTSDFKSVTTLTADGKDGENKFCCQATGLGSNWTHYYRAFILINGVKSYDEAKTFKTLEIKATVSTLQATDITGVSASLHGSLQLDSHDNLNKSVEFWYSKDAASVNELRLKGGKVSTSLESDGTCKAEALELFYSTKYYFVAVIHIHDQTFYGSVRTFTTTKSPEVVDLGLSVKWRSGNLSHFSWGETTTYSNYEWSSYKWCNGSSYKLTKYNTNSTYGTVDNKTVLDLDDDAANFQLGGNWRMPTAVEWEELKTKCKWVWTSIKGVYGMQVIGPNGNSIFLPADGYENYQTAQTSAAHYYGVRGYYWSSSLYTTDPRNARFLMFYSSGPSIGHNERCLGYSVRPVTE